MIDDEISLYLNFFVETKHDLCYVLHACIKRKKRECLSVQIRKEIL